MVITQEVQIPVYQQPADLGVAGLTRRLCLSRRSRQGKYDIAQDVRLDTGEAPLPQGEREDVGGTVLAPVSTVQGSHSLIAHEQDADFGVLLSG
jgi:hypothetical protein